MAETLPRKFRAEYSPVGPSVIRGGKPRLPVDFDTFGQNFAVKFPLWMRAAKGAATPTGRGFKVTEEMPDLMPRFEAFWREAMEELIPRADLDAPYSRGGTSLAEPLARAVTTEAERSARSAEFLHRLAQSRSPAPAVPPFADLFLRQIAVLPLASTTRAELSWDGDLGWQIELHESADLTLLFAKLAWADVEAADSVVSVEAKIFPGAQSYALWFAVLRAAQLARLAVASGLPAGAYLTIFVGHRGLSSECLKLRLDPKDRGLAMARLIRALPKNLQGCRSREPILSELPLKPSLAPIQTKHLLTRSFAPTRMVARELTWHDAKAVPALRLTYAGEADWNADYPQGLPFALTPVRAEARDPRARVSVASLGAERRAAYEAWLSGPRRESGFRPEFARLYLSGLEFRLLAERPAEEETEAILTELRAIRGLMGGGSPDRLAVESLIDWLDVTGRTPAGPLGTLGPLARLAQLGCQVLDGEPLDRDGLLHLWRQSDPGAGRLASRSELDALIARPLKLRAPLRPLLVTYRSISGLCDVERISLQHNGRPIPDLRASAVLQSIFARLSSVTAGD